MADPIPSLRDAVRRARLDDAERAAALADLRTAEVVRLEILRDTLAPVFAQIPDDTELFDQGLVPGEQPRLYVDILAFVEMGRDKRTYRFLQDTRWGRRSLAETDDIQAIAKAVTDYIARRLVEREKALAADGLATPVRRTEPHEPPRGPAPAPPVTPPPEAPPANPAVKALFWFMLGAVTAAVVLVIIGLARSRALL
jgi:hypothetical protein